ncbi:hypothetical protein V8G54_021408 [Vigna mungo]|uniref:non-specific serine/threonine protein kinase n=1 Tax=Vigna mungo TaxID=3915 RepID=A0AAQ3NFS2_VIGMU
MGAKPCGILCTNGMLSVNGGAKGLSQYYKNQQSGGMLLVSNFHLLIYVFVFMGSTFELGCASTASQVQLEANAIMNSGWWHLSPSHSLHICSWIDGISCNDAGSVTRITYMYEEGPIQLATLNLSAFKNLEHLQDFDLKYCIGTGAYGSVYRAQLPSGKIVAVKKLHGFEAEVPTFDESFRNEAKVFQAPWILLAQKNDFLIYEYMEKGSLLSVLFDDMEAIEFDWKKRVNTVKGSAHAFSYLHHDCVPPIVHRDILASNILLNYKWEPTVSDFGTARFLNLDSSNRTIVAGTIGYITPDKFFGVVALETLMGKHPKEILSSLQSTCTDDDIKLCDILDQRLSHPTF